MDRIKQFWLVAFFLLVVLPLFIAVCFVWLLFASNVNPLSPIDSSTINGLLTAIAIVFGFVSYEAREIKDSRIKVFFISILIIFLTITALFYFLTVMVDGQANKAVLFIAMCNLVFNIYCSLVVMFAKEVYDEEEDKTSKTEISNLYSNRR